MKKIKIALIEQYGHVDVLHSFYTALCNFELAIFVPASFQSMAILPDIGDNCPIYFRPEEQSIPSFLTEHKPLLDGFDWLVFITIENQFPFFARQSWKSKTIMVVHDGNYWFDYERNVSLDSLRNCGRWLRSAFLGHLDQRRRILEKMDGLIFLSSYIQSHFVKRKLVNEKKIFPCPPLVVKPAETHRFLVEEEKIIVVPGTIRADSRDYETVIGAFSKITPFLKTRACLVLLGPPHKQGGNKIQYKFKELVSEKLSVKCFHEQVSHTDYENWLGSADVMILPLKTKMRFQECVEIGGVTKISWTLVDIERFRKPFLIPEGYTLENKHSQLATRYTNEESLTKRLQEMIDGKRNVIPEIPANEEDLGRFLSAFYMI